MDNDSEFNRDEVLLRAIETEQWDVVIRILSHMSPWDVHVLTKRGDIRALLRSKGVLAELKRLRNDSAEPQEGDPWKSWLAIAAARFLMSQDEPIMIRVDVLHPGIFAKSTYFYIQRNFKNDFGEIQIRVGYNEYPKNFIYLRRIWYDIFGANAQNFNDVHYIIPPLLAKISKISQILFELLNYTGPNNLLKCYIAGPKPKDKFLREPIGRRAGGSSGKSSRSRGGQGSKFRTVMREYKRGHLHSGSKRGPLVTNPKQAAAIAYSEQRRAQSRKKK